MQYSVRDLNEFLCRVDNTSSFSLGSTLMPSRPGTEYPEGYPGLLQFLKVNSSHSAQRCLDKTVL